MRFLKSRILGVRLSVILLFIAAVVFLLMAVVPSTNGRAGWLFQIPKDAGFVLLGLFSLYIGHLTFNHMRMHLLKESPDDYSWKHVAFSSSMLISCAIIIGSVLG